MTPMPCQGKTIIGLRPHYRAAIMWYAARDGEMLGILVSIGMKTVATALLDHVQSLRSD